MLGQLLAVGCGGFIGAVARYALSGLVHHYYRGSFALGTLVVNVLGCFAVGVLMALTLDRQHLPPSTRLFLVTGILGSLTTFSTFGYETVEHLNDGDYRLAFGNAAANLVLGIGATALGAFASRWIP